MAIWIKLLGSAQVFVQQELFKTPIQQFLSGVRCDMPGTVVEGVHFFTDVRRPFFHAYRTNPQHPGIEFNVYLPCLQKGMKAIAVIPYAPYMSRCLTDGEIDECARTISNAIR